MRYLFIALLFLTACTPGSPQVQPGEASDSIKTASDLAQSFQVEHSTGRLAHTISEVSTSVEGPYTGEHLTDPNQKISLARYPAGTEIRIRTYLKYPAATIKQTGSGTTWHNWYRNETVQSAWEVTQKPFPHLARLNEGRELQLNVPTGRNYHEGLFSQTQATRKSGLGFKFTGSGTKRDKGRLLRYSFPHGPIFGTTFSYELEFDFPGPRIITDKDLVNCGGPLGGFDGDVVSYRWATKLTDPNPKVAWLVKLHNNLGYSITCGPIPPSMVRWLNATLDRGIAGDILSYTQESDGTRSHAFVLAADGVGYRRQRADELHDRYGGQGACGHFQIGNQAEVLGWYSDIHVRNQPSPAKRNGIRLLVLSREPGNVGICSADRFQAVPRPGLEDADLDKLLTALMHQAKPVIEITGRDAATGQFSFKVVSP